MSNRNSLLTKTITKEKNPETVIADIVAADRKFIKRTLNDIDNEIEDATETLNKRMSEGTPIDASVVEATYSKILALRRKKDGYESFQKEFYSAES